MKVYIELVLIDNAVMDYILLYAAFSVSKKKFAKLRLLLAAAVGAVCAALMPLIQILPAFLFIIKVAAGLLIVYIAANYKSKKQYTLCAALFFLFTFMLGGLIIGVFFMLKIDYFPDAGLVYVSKVPIGIPLLFGFVLFLFVKSVAARLYRKKNIHGFTYKCRLTLGKTSVEATGFLDSGNRLNYKGGRPVCICGAKTVSPLFKEGLFTQGTRAQYLDFSTISGRGRMMCFEIDKLEIYLGQTVNIIDNIMLGISPYHIKGDEEYELILHPAVFKENDYAQKTFKTP